VRRDATLRYFKRRWDESRGDAHDAWGRSTWYLEVGDDGRPVRQLERYDAGVALKYDETHLDDEHGGLGDQPLDLEEFRAFEIDAATFEDAWSSSVALNRSRPAH
jgi:hypothetical protein